ncbi:cardiolipin synthase A [Litorimonas cladophorae]|uniref:Cardiolipin synthase n=1 Tax=Litorimonas cladophorae TaxID=1220491 RepID=A0A918KQR0_9PROT|nr:cardiolipin synthase [Litorimonas cladophorae]GGX69932.1 cardiolipin synthase A [Litorimonas cladophorae]
MTEIPSALLIHIFLVFALGTRILYRRMAVNSTLAWLMVVAALPVAGLVLYLLFCDHRLGRKRLKLGARIREYYQKSYEVPELKVRSKNMPADTFFKDLSQVVTLETGFHASMGNKVRLFDEAGHTIAAIIEDINLAQDHCFLEFYIIEAEGRVENVLVALENAAKRGVDCRILADDIGSRGFLKSKWRHRLVAAGVKVERSLAVGVFKSFSKRTDLRNHRKLVIIDQSVGYIGSFNLVDPIEFKQGADVGQWVDIMARVEGQIVSSMSVVFNTDYIFDTSGGDYTKSTLQQFPEVSQSQASGKDTVLQLIPSGPEMRTSLIYEVIVAALFGARQSISIVTPYFVPDETIVLALTNAARRGIKITLIIPQRIDSIMARHASEAVYETLLNAGILIYRYQSGMLHTKAILIDKNVSFIGTVNMDMRSFYLNLEVTLAVYDAPFAERLDATIDRYIAYSEVLDEDRWNERSQIKRLKENCLRLAAPLL